MGKRRSLSMCERFMYMMVTCNVIILVVSLFVYVYHRHHQNNSVINSNIISNSMTDVSSSMTITNASNINVKGAIVVTLVGNYLKEYFEWSCRSIQLSSSSYDMLIFHEDNRLLEKVHCGTNVKFINIGKKGFASIIVKEIYKGDGSSSDINSMIDLVANVIDNVPRYMVEIKPMTGSLFARYLKDYSHWSYTDADIIWGNLDDWLQTDDLNSFDIITIAKTYDAGRLFMRGQFALHRNQDNTNLLWKGLDYFTVTSFSNRMEGASKLLKEGKHSVDTIYAKYFHSAEGFYSTVVFDSKVRIKVIGLGFDDFSTKPVILTNGHLIRCSFDNTKSCIEAHKSDKIMITSNSNNNKQVQAYYNDKICHMNWLPRSVRYCLAQPKNRTDETTENLQLLKVGESFSINGSWFVNPDNNDAIMKSTSRQAAFFHFRHWDDFGSSGIMTRWSNNTTDDITTTCMILYVQSNKIMFFETCADALSKDDFKKHRDGMTKHHSNRTSTKRGRRRKKSVQHEQ